MVSTIETWGNLNPAYVLDVVIVARTDGTQAYAYRVGGEGGPIYATQAAARRHIERRKERDARLARRLVEAKRAAADTIGKAARRASMSRRGVALVGGGYVGETGRATAASRREFGAGLGA